MDDEMLLSGNFQQFPECNRIYTVRLGRKNLIVEEALDSRTYTKLTEGFTSILMKDVVSSRLFNSKIDADKSAYFQLIAYPLMNISNKRRKRKKKVLTFRINEAEDEEGNMLIAETWARTIEWLIENPSITQENLQSKEAFPMKRRILVLINPKSGNGASVSKFKKFVEPILKDAGIFYHQIVTKSANQGIDIAYSLNLSEWDGIAICSGDGLAFEVIQGLMKRDDWEAAITLPLGMIPTGSGNALSASILHFSKDVFDITSAAFCVVRGQPTPIDLCSLENRKRKIFAFLSITWGIISDIDIESERFRMLGNARFTAGAVSRVLALRIYAGKLSFLPSTSVNDNVEGSKSPKADEMAFTPSVGDEETAFRTPLSSENLDSEEAVNPTLEEKKVHMQRAFSTSGIKYVRAEGLVNTSKHVRLAYSPRVQETANRSHDFSLVKEEPNQIQDAPSFKRGFSTSDVGNGAVSHSRLLSGVTRSNEMPVKGPKNQTLSPIDQDLPEGWVSIDGEFVTVMVLLISHLGSSLYSCPGLQLGDGDMWLLFLEKGTSRKSIVDVLTKMETGEHIHNSDIKIHRIQGFRLEPKFERSGYIAVDGEVVEYEAIQGQIHKGLGRVFACHQ